MPTSPDPFALLRSLNSPADLRAQSETRLGEICDQLRDYLIKSVATRGGHFAAGLGTVELTVALHYVFDTPRDRLVWDVGHQG
ncbi:MAG: 1-deoxy-D-xylulose-5-phosphate synthase N-terminal domain-containing protein, partial [Pseudomonadota bacterium]